MSVKVVMPQVGESVVEGTIDRWLKQEGDRVEKYESLVEIITDKVNTEIPAPAAGVLSKITAPSGTIVAVGQEIAVIEGEEAVSAFEEEAPAEAVEAALAPAMEAAPSAKKVEVRGEERVRASPAVRRLAQEHNLDISLIRGTGMGGRVTKEDVLNYVAQRDGGRAAVAQPEARPEAGADEEIVELTPIRRIIAENMVRSFTTIPHAWGMVEVDITNLVKWRNAIKEEFVRKEGVELSYVAFITKAVAESLKEFPILNSSWRDGKIVIKKRLNIGVAVAAPEGLIVPVIHDADAKSIAGLSKEMSRLTAKAREGKLAIEDVQGGTFTVNNAGTFGTLVGWSIISPPQAAILNSGSIVKRPMVIDDAIAIRHVMDVSISFDHRVMDGAPASGFLLSVKNRLESFGPDTPIY